jgi:hypothetical protein
VLVNLKVKDKLDCGYGEYIKSNRRLDFCFIDDKTGVAYTSNIFYRSFKGVYQNLSDNNISTITDDYQVIHCWDGAPNREDFTTEDEYRAASSKYMHESCRLPSSYGIADNLRQILKYGRHFINSPEHYVLSVQICVNNHISGDGFRWHKNGPYIGKIKPQCESFGDDKHEKVVMFDFIHLRKKQ